MDFLKFFNIIIYCLLENLYLQNLDHLFSFCNDQHFRDGIFFVNEISNGSLIYLSGLVGLYLFYITCISLALAIINPDW